MEEVKLKAKLFDSDTLNRYFQENDGDILNVGYDLSENKDYATLTVARYEKDLIRVLSTLYNDDAKLIYNLLKGRRPSVNEIVEQLKKHYRLHEINNISCELRDYVTDIINGWE